MKKLEKIKEIYNNKELKEMAVEQQERWLRAKIVMQFVFLREKLGYTQQEIADKMGVMRQQITRFENMSNSPTIFFLVKYANALDTELDVILNGVELIEVHGAFDPGICSKDHPLRASRCHCARYRRSDGLEFGYAVGKKGNLKGVPCRAFGYLQRFHRTGRGPGTVQAALRVHRRTGHSI